MKFDLFFKSSLFLILSIVFSVCTETLYSSITQKLKKAMNSKLSGGVYLCLKRSFICRYII